MSSATLKFRSLRAHLVDDVAEAARMPPTSLEQWILTCASLWFMTGLFLDGWAHHHISELETFFTPWHAVFYSGYALIVFSLLCITLRHRKIRGGSFLAAIPVGYEFAIIGAGLFLLGVLGDLIWHEVFGTEKTIEALLSPTHLILAVGGFLMITANLRAWFLTPPPLGMPKFIDQVPMLFSLTAALSTLSFFTQFSHFIMVRAGGTPPLAEMIEVSASAAIMGYLFNTTILLGCFFLIVRRAKIAFGAFSFMFTLNVLAMGLMLDGFLILPAAFVTGILADMFARRLFPLDQHVNEVRLFSFFIPCTFFLLYFMTIALTGDIWWSIHVWTGSIMMSGLTGLLLSYLVLPPREG